MKIIVLGATGLLGAPIVKEAAGRGHSVTAVSRHPEQALRHAGVTAVKCDVFDTETLANVIKGHDAVVHSYSPKHDHADNHSAPHIEATRSIITATKAAKVPYLLAVGGSGTLEVAPGVTLLASGVIPPQYVEHAKSTAEVLYLLRKETELDWTFPCPSGALFEDGGRTGKYRTGGDQLMQDAQGRAGISPDDYAIAVVDELETPRHSRQRFAVGY